MVDDLDLESSQEVGVGCQGSAVVDGLDCGQLEKLWEVEQDGERHDDSQVVAKVVGGDPTAVLELTDELSKEKKIGLNVVQ